VLSVFLSAMITQTVDGRKANPYNLANYLLSVVVLALPFYILPYAIHVRKLGGKNAANDGLFEEKTIAISKDELLVTANGIAKVWKLSALKYVSQDKYFIYISIFGGIYYVIPKSSFADQTAALNFYGTLQNAFAGIKLAGKYDDPRRLYKWGWLELIPVWGAVAGVILMFKGFGQERDKKLVLIGAGGILFTILVCYFLVPHYVVSKMAKKGLVGLTQSDVNNLVKEIEFYKMQNGIYPDSLKEVTKGDKFASIHDLMALPDAGINSQTFHYRKIGNKYTLYSVGIDGIAGTADDIYPTSTMNDTTKFGFIKAQ